MEDKHTQYLEEFEHLAGFLKREYNTIKDIAPKRAARLLLICMEAYTKLSKELCYDQDFKDLFYKACDEFKAKRPSRKLTKEEETAEIMKIATDPQKYLKVLTQEEMSKLCFREDCSSCIHNLYGTFPCTEINKREVQDYLAAKGKYSNKKYGRNKFPITVDGNEVYYNDFDEKMKLYFQSRVNFLSANVYYSYYYDPITDDEMIALFNYYNFTGTPQAKKHKDMLESLVKNIT